MSGRLWQSTISHRIFFCFYFNVGGKFEPLLNETMYKVDMTLHIRSIGPKDFGSFKCVAKNSLGETDGTIKLYRKLKISGTFCISVYCAFDFSFDWLFWMLFFAEFDMNDADCCHISFNKILICLPFFFHFYFIKRFSIGTKIKIVNKKKNLEKSVEIPFNTLNSIESQDKRFKGMFNFVWLFFGFCF